MPCEPNGVGGCAPCPTMETGECPEDPIAINACGSAFTVSAADMANTINGRCCGYASCSGANYCYAGGDGCFAPEDMDCDGDDDMTCCSIENNLFFAFQPGESCAYDISISATCSGSDCAQFQTYNVNGGLMPTGQIVSSPQSNGCFTGTQTFTALVTSSNYFYIMVDGNAGADCDMSVTITPQLSGPNACTGCILLTKEDKSSNLRAEVLGDNSVAVKWNNLNQESVNYTLMKSYTGRNYFEVENVVSSSLTNEYIDNNVDGVNNREVYYQLWKRVGQDQSLAALTVTRLKSKKIVKTRVFDVFGKEYSEGNLPSGVVIYITEFEDGTSQTRKEYISSQF